MLPLPTLGPKAGRPAVRQGGLEEGEIGVWWRRSMWGIYFDVLGNEDDITLGTTDSDDIWNLCCG